MSLAFAAPASACSWATSDYVSHGSDEATLPPNRPAPDVRVEKVDYFPGIADTSCDMAVVSLTLSVAQHHVQGASLTFERLPDSVGGTPIPPGSYKSRDVVAGRARFYFVSSPVASGRLSLRAWTVSPTGRRSETSSLSVEIPSR
jgi:hypothetical protein